MVDLNNFENYNHIEDSYFVDIVGEDNSVEVYIVEVDIEVDNFVEDIVVAVDNFAEDIVVKVKIVGVHIAEMNNFGEEYFQLY